MSVGKLYMTLGSPPVRAVLLTEKALGIQLEHGEVSVLNGDQLKADYVKLNPQHTVPMYIDQDGSKIWDSHAIMAYLVGKYGKDDSLYPKDLYQRAVVDQRLHFEGGILFPLVKSIVVGVTRKGWTKLSDELVTEVKTAYEFLNKFLEKETYMAGAKVTIADFSILTTVSTLAHLIPLNTKDLPNLAKWLKNCEGWSYFSVHAEGAAMLNGLLDSRLNKA